MNFATQLSIYISNALVLVWRTATLVVYIMFLALLVKLLIVANWSLIPGLLIIQVIIVGIDFMELAGGRTLHDVLFKAQVISAKIDLLGLLLKIVVVYQFFLIFFKIALF